MNRFVPEINPIYDSFTGKIIFKWTSQEFITIMTEIGFQLSQKAHPPLYRKVVELGAQKKCTMIAYPSGTMLLNGCSETEMKQTVNTIFNQRLNPGNKNLINFAKNLEISNYRSKVNLKIIFDLNKMDQYFEELIKKGEENDKIIKQKSSSSLPKNKIMIPQSIHKFNGVSVFITKVGMVEIYKAHLIKDVKIFVKNLYQNVLYKFARQINNKQVVQKRKIQKKTKIIKKYSQKQRKRDEQKERQFQKTRQKIFQSTRQKTLQKSYINKKNKILIQLLAENQEKQRKSKQQKQEVQAINENLNKGFTKQEMNKLLIRKSCSKF